MIALAEKYGFDKALEIISRKLNYAIDGQAVTVAERKKFRDDQRAAKQQLEEWKRNVANEVEGKVKESAAEIEFGRALKAAHETGDYDGVARALGKKDWNELQGDYIARLADPNHQRLTELERKLQEKERAEEEQRKQYEQRERQAQQQRAILQYKQGVAAEMEGSDVGPLRALAKNPDVVNMVYSIRADHYQASGVEMPLRQVLVSKLPGTDITLQTLLKGWHSQLSEAFKDEVKAAVAAATPEPEKPKGKTAPAPKVQPSASRRMIEDREFVKSGAAALEEAFRADAQREAEERRKGNSHAGS